MQVVNKRTHLVANAVLWVLLALGLAGLVVIVPAMAWELTAEFSQYKDDFVILVFLLGIPVLLGLGILGLILLLLRRIRRDQMLAATSYGPIKWLIISTAALSTAFVLIGVWLSLKNTLPPVILIVLAVFALISLAVSLVTKVLFGLLEQAVAHSEELNEVI